MCVSTKDGFRMFHMFCSMFFIIFNTYRLQSVCLEGLKQPRAELPKGAKMSETRAGETVCTLICIIWSVHLLPYGSIWVFPNMVYVPKPFKNMGSLLQFKCSNFDDLGYPYWKPPHPAIIQPQRLSTSATFFFSLMSSDTALESVTCCWAKTKWHHLTV